MTNIGNYGNSTWLPPMGMVANESVTTSEGSVLEPPAVGLSRDIMFYSLSVIIPVGLVCNTISVFSFMTRRLRVRAASWYLAALAVSDALSLLSAMFDYWLKDPRIGLPIVKSSHVLCVVITYISYASRLLSAWLVTSFTIERFIGVVFPLKRSSFSTTTHARRVVTVEAIICLLATSFVIFTIGIIEAPYGGKECDVRRDMAHVYFIFNIIFLIFGSIVIPILVIVPLNLFILHKVYQRRKMFGCKNMRFSRSGQRVAYKRTSDYNIATVLLVVSSAFVVLNAPYCVCWLILFCTTRLNKGGVAPTLFAAKYITSVPYYLNYSINFALYNCCARAFRQSVQRIVYCQGGGKCLRRNSSNDANAGLMLQEVRPPPPPAPKPASRLDFLCHRTSSQSHYTDSDVTPQPASSGNPACFTFFATPVNGQAGPVWAGHHERPPNNVHTSRSN